MLPGQGHIARVTARRRGAYAALCAITLLSPASIAEKLNNGDYSDVPVLCTPEHPLVVWRNSVPIDMYPPYSREQRALALTRFERFIGCKKYWRIGSDSEAAAQTTAIDAGDVRIKGHPYFGKVKGYNRKTGVTRMW